MLPWQAKAEKEDWTVIRKVNEGWDYKWIMAGTKKQAKAAANRSFYGRTYLAKDPAYLAVPVKELGQYGLDPAYYDDDID